MLLFGGVSAQQDESKQDTGLPPLLLASAHPTFAGRPLLPPHTASPLVVAVAVEPATVTMPAFAIARRFPLCENRTPPPARYPCGLMQGDDKAKATVDAMMSGLLKDVSKYSLEKGVATSVLTNRKDLVRQVRACGVRVVVGCIHHALDMF